MPALKAPYLIVMITAVSGITLGLGAFTFLYGKGFSYLQSDSSACKNCHIMNEQYDGWTKSSHRLVAGCNDCHTPTGPIAKYVVKASNGFWHSYAFTTGDFHEPIQIKASNLDVTQTRCRQCHEAITAQITHTGQTDCVRCHRSVGHAH